MEKENRPPISPTLDVEKPECGSEPEKIAEAARQLAYLPRRKKRIWSGWLNSTRTYCGMPIRLSTGERMFIFGVLRGRVIYSREPGVLSNGIDGAGIHWGVVRSDHVEIVKNAAACLLGSRKAGIVEVKSEAKARAARINGKRPCRRGRQRGRPTSVSGTV